MASAEPVSIEDFHIINCDFRAVGERIKSHSVDVAIVDPPWAEWEALGRPLGGNSAVYYDPTASPVSTLEAIMKINGTTPSRTPA